MYKSPLLPKHKSDTDSVKILDSASDAEVLDVAEQLLEWLQDVNWPVFKGIVSRLSTLGAELERPIIQILEGKDCIWRANVIGHLIPAFSVENQRLYTQSLETILKEFSEDDLKEGVIDFVEIQLSNVQKNTYQANQAVRKAHSDAPASR